MVGQTGIVPGIYSIIKGVLKANHQRHLIGGSWAIKTLGVLAETGLQVVMILSRSELNPRDSLLESLTMQLKDCTQFKHKMPVVFRGKYDDKLALGLLTKDGNRWFIWSNSPYYSGAYDELNAEYAHKHGFKRSWTIDRFWTPGVERINEIYSTEKFFTRDVSEYATQ